MRERHILIASVVLLSGFLIYIGACVVMGYPMCLNKESSQYMKAVTTGHEGEPIPNMELLLLDSTTVIDIASEPPGRSIVLFYFGPYCPYCQLEMKEIISNMDHLKDLRFYLISPYSLSAIREFSDMYHLERFENVKVGLDRNYKFGNYYNTSNIPYLVFYSPEKKLKAAFFGNVKYPQMRAVIGQ